jgi:hypothetical protein
MLGYNKDVWFSTRAIANIVALSNFIQQYRVTYDSDDKMFVVHRESQGKPNMEFRMHKCGLNYFDTRNEKHAAFVNNVSENKEGFRKRQIKGADLARTLYKTLSYLSMQDLKWGDSKQSDQRFSSDSPRYRFRSEYLGQEQHLFERQDHLAQDDFGDQGLCQSSFGVNEAP